MDDAAVRFRAASEANDLDGMMATLASDAELISPISGRLVFRGSADLRILLRAIYSTIAHVRWDPVVGDGATRVLVGEAKVGPFTLGDSMVLELAPDGQIQTMRPHLRPWLGLTALAARLGPSLLGHPGVLRRAFQQSGY